MSTDTAIDFDAFYAVNGWGGIAFYLTGYATETVYEGDLLVCDDEECDHGLSEMCWAEGDYSIVTNPDMVKAIMVGDDTVHLIDVEDLRPLAREEFCGECGQIGCTHDGLERD